MATERTLVLVKPDGVRRGLTGEVLRRIETKGYALVALDMRPAGRDTLERHYAEHLGKPFYEPLVEFMCVRPGGGGGGRGRAGDRGLPQPGRGDRADRGRAGHDPR